MKSECPNFIKQQMNAVGTLLKSSASKYKSAFEKLKEKYDIDAKTGPQNVWLAYETEFTKRGMDSTL